MTAEFVKQRQAAWDKYQEQRAKQGLLRLPSDSIIPTSGEHYVFASARGFDAGFSAAWNILADQVETLQQCVGADLESARSRSTDKQPVSQRVGKLWQDVVRVLEGGDELTATEIAKRIGVPRDSISPRMSGLKRRGLVHVTGASGREWRYKIGNGIA